MEKFIRHYHLGWVNDRPSVILKTSQKSLLQQPYPGILFLYWSCISTRSRSIQHAERHIQIEFSQHISPPLRNSGRQKTPPFFLSSRPDIKLISTSENHINSVQLSRILTPPHLQLSTPSGAFSRRRSCARKCGILLSYTVVPNPHQCLDLSLLFDSSHLPSSHSGKFLNRPAKGCSFFYT